MAHEIMETDSMFSVRKMPWHGLGNVLERYPEGIDDALAQSGLTWEVGQDTIYRIVQNSVGGNLTEIPNAQANVRRDTDRVLGIVGKDYRVVQNREAFAWLDNVLGTDVEFETAGSLQNGKRVWVLARRPDNVEVGGDEVVRYVYCANSHDGSMAVTAAATNIRVVCANTLNWALKSSGGRSYSFRHTGDLSIKLDEARKAMEVTLNWDAAFKELGDRLALEKLSTGRFMEGVVEPLIKIQDEMGDRAKENRIETRTLLHEIFVGAGPDGDTSGNSPGTKWTAANAVAEYADWGRRYTQRTDQMGRSFEDARIKQQGLELVIAA